MAVLMNTYDPESMLIGEYFQDKNDIPDENMLYVSMPTSDHIDSLQYSIIANEVQGFFNANPQSDEINYIVTTKVCPQAVSIELQSFSFRSFEILMSNLNTTGVFEILNISEEDFSFADANYRIVSRLEAGTLQGAYGLVDRGGLQSIDLNSNIVLDFYAPSNIQNFDFNYVVEEFDAISMSLLDAGFKTELDTVQSYYNSEINVSIYSQLGFGNTDVPISTFVENTKSLAILTIGDSAYKSKYGDGLSIFNFLEEKCHGAIGYIDYFYLSVIGRHSNFFDNYLNIEKGFTLGESAYSSLNTSCPFVLFGDPKSKISEITSTSNLDIPIISDIYPIPTADYLNINFDNQKERYLIIHDVNGKFLFSQTIVHQENRIDISDLPNGFLIVGVKEGDQVDMRKIIKL